ncbi:site-specific integrase [Sphingobacterium paludis]|uniref:Site-specific recombinase XerD n=1 Tax=Sphingobacterium paludis TaxID=1476465 RepID=A0A4R7CSI0_9SPHI|nr:site-specific integrase [Sphingobacterium paludis]TDS10951.1 site-specific recombinase XerD [Sphingobacterium paludis]
MDTKNVNTFGIHFIIRSAKSQKSKLASVYARISVNGRRAEISLKRKVSPDQWSDLKGRAKGRSEEVVKLNIQIDRMRTLIAEAYHALVEKGKVVSVEAIKNSIAGKDDSLMSLCSLMEYHNSECADNLAQGTMKNYYTTQRYVKSFLKSCYNGDIALSELTYKFIIDFERYLQRFEPLDHHKKMANNGVMKHMERLRKMVNLAARFDWIDKDPFSKYKLHFDKIERGYLTQEELNKIQLKDLYVERLQSVKDMFIFCCYTGLAYVDMMNLTEANVIKGIDGGYWLNTQRQKTDTVVKVPLLPHALALIEKYQAHPKASNERRLFPVISNQRMNGYLKEIADICGIKKNLTFHLARHTFATTITLSNGVPIESVSSMLGHTSIRTTQIYAKVVEGKLSKDMLDLKNKMQMT